MKTQDLPNDTKGEIVIYQSDEGKAAIDVILQDETVWVTQEQMVALFGKAKSTRCSHFCWLSRSFCARYAFSSVGNAAHP